MPRILTYYISFFTGVDQDAFNKFDQVAYYREYQPDEVIISEGGAEKCSDGN